jgi:MFS family permease
LRLPASIGNAAIQKTPGENAMTTQTISTPHAESEAQDSWLPMVAIAFGQVLMSFNVASLPVAIGGMVADFNVPPTTVATGIVMYSLAVAGLVMLGAKLCQRFGALRVFRAVVLMFGVALCSSESYCTSFARRRANSSLVIDPDCFRRSSFAISSAALNPTTCRSSSRAR